MDLADSLPETRLRTRERAAVIVCTLQFFNSRTSLKWCHRCRYALLYITILLFLGTARVASRHNIVRSGKRSMSNSRVLEIMIGLAPNCNIKVPFFDWSNLYPNNQLNLHLR